MITPQIVDNLIAYKRAVVDTTTAEIREDWDEVNSCREEENVRLNGLFAVIQIAINEAASLGPHSPFAINGDVNQPVSFICDNGMMTEPRNEHGTFPPTPTKD